MKKDCLICGKEIIKSPKISINTWINRRKYCSRECSCKGLHKNNIGRRTGEYRKCKVCGESFYIIPAHIKRRKSNGQYCSKKCMYKSPERNNKLSGSNHYLWKGEKANYRTKHAWINRQRGRPSECEHCGTTIAKKYEWANKDHKYRRRIEDYIALCSKCHFRYDGQHLRERGYHGRYI